MPRGRDAFSQEAGHQVGHAIGELLDDPVPGIGEIFDPERAADVVVNLDQPIGARRLLDGSFLPPHDPTRPLI